MSGVRKARVTGSSDDEVRAAVEAVESPGPQGMKEGVGGRDRVNRVLRNDDWWHEKSMDDLGSSEVTSNLLTGLMFREFDYMSPEIELGENNCLYSRDVGPEAVVADDMDIDTVPSRDKTVDSLFMAGAGKLIAGDRDLADNFLYNPDEEVFEAFDYDKAGSSLEDTFETVSRYIFDILQETAEDEFDREEVERRLFDTAKGYAAFLDVEYVEEQLKQTAYDDIDASVVEEVEANVEELQQYAGEGAGFDEFYERNLEREDENEDAAVIM